jgi:hypothetical protein
MNNRTARHLRWLGVFAVGSLAALFLFVPAIPQTQEYHDFADGRTLALRIPNTLNVLSNMGFAIAGVVGLLVARGSRRFANDLERGDARMFFIGTLLTAIGSTIYHLTPSDGTLVYDRLGMIVAFMPFLAMMIHERYEGARWLLPVLLIVGAASVWWWRTFDDLRLYGWVQFFPMVCVFVIPILDRPRHTREALALSAVVIAYATAKVLETFDHATFSATGGHVSGHTLKHLFAAGAPLTIALWIRSRTSAERIAPTVHAELASADSL